MRGNVSNFFAVCLLGIWSTDLQAAEGSASSAIEEVVVTGTYIRGAAEDAALPVDVISAQDLDQQGSPSTIEIIKNLPSAGSSLGESNRFTSSAAGAATVNLRGFGDNRTLVLLNGQRMADSPLLTGASAGAIDINMIPRPAIAKIEVLRDGAAATYGSDAVGGVVNFITRRGFEGLELDAKYSSIDKSDGDYEINAIFGWASDNMDGFVTATYRHRSEIMTSERDWAIRPFAENFLGGWSSSANPGTYSTGTAADLDAGTFSQNFVDNGCTELGGVSSGSGCRFQYTQFYNLVNNEDHYQVYGELNVDLEGGWGLHTELLWAEHTVPDERVSPSSSNTQYPTPIEQSGGSPGGGSSPYPAVGLNQQSRYYIPPTNPGLAAFLANPENCPGLDDICANAAANGVITSQTGWRPLGFVGNPLFDDYATNEERKADALRLSARLQGQLFPGIGSNIAVTYMRSDGTRELRDFAVTRLQLGLRGLGGEGCNPDTGTPGSGPCQYFNTFTNSSPSNPILGLDNPYYAPGTENDPELIRWMQVPIYTFATTDLITAEAILDGSLDWELSGGAPGWAAGLQYRNKGVDYRRNDVGDLIKTPCIDSEPFGDGTPMCTDGSGAFPFYSADAPYDISRDVWAVFGELLLPLTSSFEVTAAVRHESYGGRIGSTTNPKVSARWQATDWFALRGSAGTTFRAPPQTLIAPGFNRGQSQLSLPGAGAIYRPVDVHNNPDLEPETADTFNFGVLLSFHGFTASIDYFRFQFEKEITTESTSAIVSTMFPSADPASWLCGDPQVRARFTFVDDANPATDDCSPGNVLSARTNRINGPDIDTSGIDFALSQEWFDILGGDVRLGVNGTYLFEYERGQVRSLEGFVIDGAEDLAGLSNLITGIYSFPELRGNAYANFNRNQHNVRWTVRYKKSAVAVFPPFPPQDVEDEIVHELTYTNNLTDSTTVTLHVQNVLDEDPPFTRSFFNYDATNGYFLGRVVEVGLKHKF